jgi:signal transduction histidine kinase
MAADVGQAFSPIIALVVVVAAGTTIAWRLVAPELPVYAVCAVHLALAVTAPGEFAPQTTVLGVLVVVYSAAVHLSGRRAVIAAAVALTVVWIAHVGSAEGEAADFLPFLVWGAPWLVGRLARRQMLQARADGARAAVLLAEQEAQTRDAAIRERDRIARELHDVVAHAVSLIVVQAGAERLAHPDGPSRGTLEAIETSGRQALVELRSMLGVLREAPDESTAPQPDLSSLPALVERVRDAGLPVVLRTSGTGEVPPGVALSAYRVVQEALTNALRHGGAVPTEVLVEVGADVVVEVRSLLPSTDRASSSGGGRGVVGMRERVALHDGSLDAGPEGTQWVVRARLPLATT